MPEWQSVKTPKPHLVFAGGSTRRNRESGWLCVEGDGLSIIIDKAEHRALRLSRGLLYIWSQCSTTDKISCTYSCTMNRELHLIQ